MINIGLSPNLTPEDSWLALKMLFQPWRWKNGPEIKQLEDWFKTNMFHKTDKQGIEAVSFNSGRSAEFAILKTLGIKEKDEVLLQAFTCVAVPNSILWLGGKPIFVDIEKETLNMDPVDLQRKITPKSKAIIVQHTFGQLAQLEKICRIAKEHNLFVIEDCAHIIKNNIKGDAAFFSFGRDKAVSSVFGGVGIINDNFYKNYNNYKNKLDFPSYFWIFQQLLHPVAMAVILPLCDLVHLGKLLLFVLQKLKLLSFPVYPEEKQGLKPKDFPKRMPNALAELALGQLAQLDRFEIKRKEIVKIYQKELKSLDSGHIRQAQCKQARMTERMLKLIQHDVKTTSLLRYSLLVEKPDELRKFAKQRGIILGNWYSNVIDPKGTDFQKIGYQKNSCPAAEEIAGKIVNLPTYPRMKINDVYEVIEIIRQYFLNDIGFIRSPLAETPRKARGQGSGL